jgi:hypothetical protein
LALLALCESAPFGEQRREGGFLAIDQRTTRRTQCRSNAERGCGSDLTRDLDRAIELLRIELERDVDGRPHRPPFIACQHVAHRIAPSCLANEVDRRTAGREDTPGRFCLGENGIASWPLQALARASRTLRLSPSGLLAAHDSPTLAYLLTNN